MNAKLIQWFYGISESTYYQHKKYIDQVNQNIAVALFLFNIISVCFSFSIITITKNYEYAFDFLAGTSLIFTVFFIGGYSIYKKRQINLHVSSKKKTTRIFMDAIISIVYMSFGVFLLTAITDCLSFHTSLISELSNPMNYIIPVIIGAVYGLIFGIVNWYKRK